MPSQIPLRTSTLSSKVQVPKTVCSKFPASENDMQAAARTVSNFLVSRSSQAMVPCSKAGGSNGKLWYSTPSLNGDSAMLPVNGDVQHYNSYQEQWKQAPSSRSPRTIGAQSSDQNSLTDESNSGRLMCPELAISYTNALIGKRANCLANKQKHLEMQVAELQRKVRQTQLDFVHSHANRQLQFCHSKQECLTVDEAASTPISSEQYVEESSSCLAGVMPLPIQVDGASDDAFLAPEEEPRTMGMEGRVRNEDSFSSMESFTSSSTSEVDGSGTLALTAQLISLEALVDSDLTENSSDEEEDFLSTDMNSREDLRAFWDHARSKVGSRWAWLQRRIAELNKQIYRLDHHMKEYCSRDKFEFGAGLESSNSQPRYFSLSGSSVLEHLRGTNTSGLIAVGKTNGPKPGNNGFSHHTTSHCLPHLLLPEAFLGTTGAKLQVKDLLSPSPVGQNLIYFDEANYGAARSRPLIRRARRKVVRKKSKGKGRNSVHADLGFHPQLSMAYELPSRVALDCSLKQILSEHSYSQFPLPKRLKHIPPLPQLATPHHHHQHSNHHPNQQHEYEQSRSPSPINTPLSLDSSKGGSSRKKSFLHHHTSSLDSSLWSPGSSRPSTPNYFTPLPRKRRMTGSTPLFDIDNIVIPYSMAASTRLEKLEYKEIMTPSWRRIEDQESSSAGRTRGKKAKGSHGQLKQCGTEGQTEDLSDQAYSNRHSRSELTEKKRFINFISGNQRKRGRPQSMTLTDSPGPLQSPPPPPRRVTIASPSPSHTEPELAAHVHTVVLPWPPRVFPLAGSDFEALSNPPPPPPRPTVVTHPEAASPLAHFLTSTPSQTPSCSSSALATPLSSPLTTPTEETPAVSPAEWVVNNSHPPCTTSALFSHHKTQGWDSARENSPLPHNPIILKLTKKV